MYYCWDKDPTQRPSFSQLVKVSHWDFMKNISKTCNIIRLFIFQDFERLLIKETDYIDLNQFPDHAYYNEVQLRGEKV